MIHGVISRVRDSFSKHLIDHKTFSHMLKDCFAVRDTMDEVEIEVLEKRVKKLVRVCGCWSLFHFLELYHGEDFAHKFQPATYERIKLYNDVFAPAVFLSRVADEESEDYDSEEENEFPEAIPPMVTPFGASVAGSLNSNILTDGGLFLTQPTGMMLGHYIEEPSDYYLSYPYLQQKLENILHPERQFRSSTPPFSPSEESDYYDAEQALEGAEQALEGAKQALEDTEQAVEGAEQPPKRRKNGKGKATVHKKTFETDYMKNMSLRDVILKSEEEIAGRVKDAKILGNKLRKRADVGLLRYFKKQDLNGRREVVVLMLLLEIKKNLLPELRDIVGKKDFEKIRSSLHLQRQTELMVAIKNHEGASRHLPDKKKRKRKRAQVRSVEEGEEEEQTYRARVLRSNAPQEAIDVALQKVNMLEKARGSGDAKAEQWLDGFLKIPFGTFHEATVVRQRNAIMALANQLARKVQGKDAVVRFESEINRILETARQKQKQKRATAKLEKSIRAAKSDRTEFLKSSRKILDEAVFGHDEAKKHLERVIAQWVTGEQVGTVIGLQGCPGNGKTSLVQQGIAKCLKDADGKDHPFSLISLGGQVNSSSLIGHGFTYVGSEYGKIVGAVIRNKCLNPVILFDELDKVSGTERGREIISVLTHLTDETTNKNFQDEYFKGVPLDLSKALIVFTFNDLSRVDRVLRDRIQIIRTKALRMPEKITIAQNYLLPRLLPTIGFSPDAVKISEDNIRWIVEDYTAEGGVRRMKQILTDAVRELNRAIVSGEYKGPSNPYVLDRPFLERLFHRRHKIIHDKVSKSAKVGVMNGMYANSTGLGGITTIQVSKIHSKTPLEMTLTGNQGDVMKESMHCARSVAWRSLPEEIQKKDHTFGLHIHCPSGSTPKDGPSAGGAITLSIYSLLSNRPINPTIAMTGEIDLNGNITIIGGLDEKLLGCKKAGVRHAFIPKENKKDLEKIYEDKLLARDDKDFKVTLVREISEVLCRNDVFV